MMNTDSWLWYIYLLHFKNIFCLFLIYFLVCVGCVRPGIQSEDQNQFFTFKVRTFWHSEVKISVLALWLGALSSLFHNIGVGGYGRYPLFVCDRGVQRCVKNFPHFECVIHRFVLALNDGTNTLMPGRTHYTHVCIMCPHFECRDRWGGGGVCVCVNRWCCGGYMWRGVHVIGVWWALLKVVRGERQRGV